jgi:hypothetical protein
MITKLSEGEMKTKLAISAALVIIASLGVMQSAFAKGTPFQAGYDHGCSDAKLPFSASYINEPDKGHRFHTQEFMNGYNTGFSACGSESSPVASNVGDDSSSSSSSQFKQGFANGVSDARAAAKANKLGSSPIVGVDCDNEIDPRFDNQDYCNGYTKGYMGEANKLTGQ